MFVLWTTMAIVYEIQLIDEPTGLRTAPQQAMPLHMGGLRVASNTGQSIHAVDMQRGFNLQI